MISFRNARRRTQDLSNSKYPLLLLLLLFVHHHHPSFNHTQRSKFYEQERKPCFPSISCSGCLLTQFSSQRRKRRREGKKKGNSGQSRDQQE
jgi:hypothetical protein